VSSSSTVEPASSPAAQQYAGEREARFVSWLTIGWNVTEAVIALIAAIQAGSPALLGFGLDSVVESMSSLVMIWRFQDPQRGRRREKRARTFVGMGLVLLAGFVAWDASQALILGEAPHESLVGIILAVVSILLMPLLAQWKRRIAHKIQSGALHADASQTDICWYLASILLVGVGLNALFGWWWADPVAALCMVPLIGKAGIQALRGKNPCCA
jgi:divalent metal cation (Fe/Co/Zn/Cd) transporter